MKRYETTPDTIGRYRALSPMDLEGALYVDTDSCVYDTDPPSRVLAACAVATEITAEELADLNA